MAQLSLRPRMQDARSPWQRVRAAFLLVLTVAILGSLLAGILGTAIALIVTSFQHASAK
jgi:hypothetical protein